MLCSALLLNPNERANLPAFGFYLLCSKRCEPAFRPDVQVVRLPLITYEWWRRMQLHHFVRTTQVPRQALLPATAANDADDKTPDDETSDENKMGKPTTKPTTTKKKKKKKKKKGRRRKRKRKAILLLGTLQGAE